MSVSDDGVLESFFSGAQDVADDSIEYALQIVDPNSTDENIHAIFRGVHSLKGAASFLGSSDARLETLTEYCHKFETYLNGIRDGSTPLTPEVRQLIAEGLNTLHDDIYRLVGGGEIERHGELFVKFDTPSNGLLRLENKNGFLIVRPVKNLQLLDDVEQFARIIWERAKSLGPEGKLILDLDNRIHLSSITVGSLIGMVSIIKKVYIVNSPRFMEMVFKRFRLKEIGIDIKSSISECT